MRLARSKVSTDDAVIKLFSQVAPSTSSRQSGHLRIEKTRLRRGDGAQLARVSFVDNITAKPKTAKPKTAKKETVSKANATKSKSVASSKAVADEKNEEKVVKS